MFVASLYFVGVQNGQHIEYYLISVAGAALHITWQLVTVDTENPDDCLSKFLVRRFDRAKVFADEILLRRIIMSDILFGPEC